MLILQKLHLIFVKYCWLSTVLGGTQNAIDASFTREYTKITTMTPQSIVSVRHTIITDPQNPKRLSLDYTLVQN